MRTGKAWKPVKLNLRSQLYKVQEKSIKKTQIDGNITSFCIKMIMTHEHVINTLFIRFTNVHHSKVNSRALIIKKYENDPKADLVPL